MTSNGSQKLYFVYPPLPRDEKDTTRWARDWEQEYRRASRRLQEELDRLSARIAALELKTP